MTFAKINNIRLHYKEAGEGDLILFLHGFPEYSGIWKKQLSFFSKKGFHAVALDLRGYNLSDKPKGIKSYDLEILMSDIIGLIKHLNKKKVILVGHDWGGFLSWFIAMYHPNLIKKMVIINCPHPSLTKEGLKKFHVRTLLYLFFQLPIIPELFTFFVGKRLFKRRLENIISKKDLNNYMEVFSKRNSFNGPINYYRAYARTFIKGLDMKKIITPTLIIWGNKDKYLDKKISVPEKGMVKNLNLKCYDSGHWLPQEIPHKINQDIFKFINN